MYNILTAVTIFFLLSNLCSVSFAHQYIINWKMHYDKLVMHKLYNKSCIALKLFFSLPHHIFSSPELPMCPSELSFLWHYLSHFI